MHLVRLPSCESEKEGPWGQLLSAAKSSWWLALLAAFLLIGHERGVIDQRERMEAVSEQLASLEKRREELACEQRYLQAQLTHGADPAWMERVLMKHLGLAPKGYRRVHFEQRVAQ